MKKSGLIGIEQCFSKAVETPGDAERLLGGDHATRGRWGGGAIRCFRTRNKDTTSCQNNDTIFLNIN